MARPLPLLLLCALCAPAFAQAPAKPAIPKPGPKPGEPDSAAARQRAEALLAKLQLNEQDLRPRTFSLLLAGKPVGVLTFTIAREGQGFRAKCQNSVRLPDYQLDLQINATLGPKLGLLGAEEKRTTTSGGVKQEVQTRRAAQGAQRTQELTQGGKTVRSQGKLAGPDHGTLISHLWLISKLDLSKPGRYAFRRVLWPKAAETSFRTVPFALEVRAPQQVAMRGKLETLTPVAMLGEDLKGLAGTFLFSPQGKLVGLLPAGSPFIMLACRDAAAAKQAPPRYAPPELSAPIATYFGYLAHKKTLAELDACMDYARVAKQWPGAKADTIRAAYASLLKRPPRIPAGELPKIAAGFNYVRRAHRAWAYKGARQAFLLELQGKRWKIVRIPRK